MRQVFVPKPVRFQGSLHPFFQLVVGAVGVEIQLKVGDLAREFNGSRVFGLAILNGGHEAAHEPRAFGECFVIGLTRLDRPSLCLKLLMQIFSAAGD